MSDPSERISGIETVAWIPAARVSFKMAGNRSGVGFGSIEDDDLFVTNRSGDGERRVDGDVDIALSD